MSSSSRQYITVQGEQLYYNQKEVDDYFSFIKNTGVAFINFSHRGPTKDQLVTDFIHALREQQAEEERTWGPQVEEASFPSRAEVGKPSESHRVPVIGNAL